MVWILTWFLKNIFNIELVSFCVLWKMFLKYPRIKIGLLSDSKISCFEFLRDFKNHFVATIWSVSVFHVELCFGSG